MIGLKLRMNRMIINFLFIWVWKVAILIKINRETCRSITRLTAIICCENLNPRSNSLKGNLEELRLSFEADELRKKLYVSFTFGTSTKASSLEKLREDVLDFNEMFKMLNINILNVNDKKRFLGKKVWRLDLMDQPIPSPTCSFANLAVILILVLIISIIYTFYHYRNQSAVDLMVNESSKFNSSLFVAHETIEINENLANSKASSIFFEKLTDVNSQNLFNDTTLVLKIGPFKFSDAFLFFLRRIRKMKICTCI
jgi:hypothetical protein